MTTFGKNVYDRAEARYVRRSNTLSYVPTTANVRLMIEAVRLMHRLEDEGFRPLSIGEQAAADDRAWS